MRQTRVIILSVGIIVLTLLLVGCNNRSEPMPIQDSSIVWSDDFEDGDLDGWEIINTGSGGFFADENFLKTEGIGVLGARYDSVIQHSSPVTNGTWSFDINFVEPPHIDYDNSCYIGLFSNMSFSNVYIENPVSEWMKNPDFRSKALGSENKFTGSLVYEWWEHPDFISLALHYISETLYLSVLAEGKNIVVAQYPIRGLLGWQHIDVTRDPQGRAIVYLNGEQLFDYSDDRFSKSQVFYIAYPYSILDFDNFVIRNEVIEIKPPGD